MISNLNGWQRLAVAATLGAVAAFGQAPYELPAAMVLALALAFHGFRDAVTPQQAALYGWAFGAGYFAHALQWIVSPFMVDVARHGWMAPFALLFMAAGLALFWGMAFWVARWLSARAIWPLLLTLPAAELLRAYVLTGFPWAMPAQALLDTPLSPLLAWIGPHGLNIVVVALSMLPVASRDPLGRPPAIGGIAVLYLLVFAVLPGPRDMPVLTEYRVRLIQPNAAQHEKWDPDMIPVFFNRQLTYSAAPPSAGEAAPDLILWPETAIPWRLDLAESVLREIAGAGGPATVALGAQRMEGEDFFNAFTVLGQGGEAAQVYDKQHLVPFGEYVPLAPVLNRLGIFGLAQTLPVGFTAGPGPQLLNLGPLGQALPLICYEAVFPQDVNTAPERPDFLIQATNDAWFGRGAGPRQHLAQARMRAIEQGLPLARAANTGISAMIGPRGRIIAFLPLNEAGFVDAPLPAPLAPTLYSRTGDLPLAVLLLAGLAWATIRMRRV